MISVTSHRSGMPGLKDVAVQLGISAARVVGDEGELGVEGPGGGQRDSTQSVSHQESLQTKTTNTYFHLRWLQVQSHKTSMNV